MSNPKMKLSTEQLIPNEQGIKLDKFGQMIFTTDQISDALLARPSAKISDFFVLDDTQYRQATQALMTGFEQPRIYDPSVLEKSVSEFDAQQQHTWLVPEAYQDLDILSWMLDQAPDDQARERVCEEYKLYEQFQLLDFLKFLKYMVDELRKNNIILGLGRGSSVSSYCLYLIGVHKINPLKYGLDVGEFLR